MFKYLFLFLFLIILYLIVSYLITEVFDIFKSKKQDYNTETYNKWMNDFFSSDENEVKLSQLIIPATHNSSSYKMNENNYLGDNLIFLLLSKIKIFNNVLKKWTVNQDSDIYTQLKRGIRFLDIDIYEKNNEYYSGHEFENDNIINNMEEITSFMDDEPTEVIFLSFTCRGMEKEEKNRFIEIIYNKYKDYINTSFKKTPSKLISTKMSDLIKEDKKLFIIFDIVTEYTYLYTTLYDIIPWLDTNNSEITLKENMENINIHVNNDNNNKLIYTSWILTGNNSDAIKSTACQYCDNGNRAQAKNINGKIHNILSILRYKKKNGIIPIMDYPEDSTIKKLLDYNKLLSHKRSELLKKILAEREKSKSQT